MDYNEFSGKLKKLTKDMPAKDQELLMNIFKESISKEYIESDSKGNVVEEGQITGLTERLSFLKQNFVKHTPGISIHRAKAITKIAKENPGLEPILLRSKSFKYCCETAPNVIQDKELIVGSPSGAPRMGSFSPDIAWRWVLDEIDTMATRAQDPFVISEEDKKTLKEEIFPYWEGKSVDEYCETSFREAGLWEFTAESYVSDFAYHQISGGGDSIPGFDVILMKKGMKDLKEEALSHLKELDYENPEDVEKIYYYKSVLETTEGVMAYARNISEKAKAMADIETDLGRKAELYKISEVNAKVPANKPETFWEALQSVWTIQSLLLVEENQTGLSLGRVDQFLYPFYKADMEAGRLTKQSAYELIGCFIVKIAELMWISSAGFAEFFAGYQVFVNMCVGGVDCEGRDATNDLSYLFMDAVRFVKVYQPSLSCRIHKNTPLEFLRKVVDVVRAGNGFPACHFDDAHIKMMLAKGVPLKDARDYSLMGCVEPQASGRLHQWTAVAYTQWPLCIEMAMNGGVPLHYGKQVVPDCGDLSRFKTFEEFEKAVKSILSYVIKWTAVGTVIVEKVHRNIAPKPLMSLLYVGCMENGKDVSAGGAIYNYGPGAVWTGLATYADSMAAIKKLVFDEKKYTLDELNNAMKADFIGYENIRNDCLAAPKYGNDDDYVDYIAADLISFTEDEHNKQKTLYSRMSHGTLSTSNNTPLGMITAATADGRKAWTPLSDGISPVQGVDVKGPTAVMKSVSKMLAEDMNIGMVHNFKFTSGLIDTPEGSEGVVSLLRAGCNMGLGQMQFNYVDNKLMLEAQKNPEKYRDLIVRVAGYSAYFVELCKAVQDEIISRTTLSSL